MNNNRIKLLKEEKTVNEIQLQDLFDLASNTEKQVITLASMAVKFNDAGVKRAALELKSKGQQFASLLSDIMMGETTEETPQRIETGKDGNIIEAIEPSFEEERVNEDVDQLLETLTGLVEEESKNVDLTEIYEEVMENFNESSFPGFKEKVVSALKENKNKIYTVAGKEVKEFNFLVETLNRVTSISSFDTTMDKIYDFCDKHSITIKTA